MKKKMNIVAISPHADDVEIAMGGTVALLTSQGHNVTIVTSILPNENINGKIDSYMNKKRKQEQLNAAKALGAKVEILGLDKNEFTFNRKFIKIFDDKIKQLKPSIIFSCWEHDTHQDHQSLAKIIFSVTRKNNISLYMYEAMLPGGINTQAFNPQLFINVTKTMNKKIKALKCYKSVFIRKKNNYSNYFESIIGRARFRGGMIGQKYAESFVVVKQLKL